MNSHRKTAVFVFGLDARRIGGIEFQTREVIGRLGERGWKTVLCFDRPPHPLVREYLSLPGVVWETLPRAAGSSLRSAIDLAAVLLRHRPDLLHFQFASLLSFNAWLGRLCGVSRIVFTDHHSRPQGFQPRRQPVWKRAVGRLITLPVSAMVAVSDFNRIAMATPGTFPSNRIHLIYNGADLTFTPAAAQASGAAFRSRYSIPPDRILVTQASSVNSQKGVPDLLEAARIAIAVEPRLHFAMVGDGDRRDEYIRQALAMGLGDHFCFPGLILYPMMEGVFAAADIACQASRWQEAFGLVIAEAMAFSKPVVATRVGGIPEVVADGKTGILTEPGDPRALAEAFIRLARDPGLRQRFGAAGFERARAMFNVRDNVKPLLRIYGLHL